MTSPSNEPIQQLIEKVASFVETAQRLIYQSKIVDVTALEIKTVQLCEALEKLPPNESKPLVPTVEKLFKSIEQLEKDLDMQHDAVTERLQFSDTHVNPLMAQEVTEEDE